MTKEIDQDQYKIIVAPEKWSGIVPENEIDTVLNDWVRIDN